MNAKLILGVGLKFVRAGAMAVLVASGLVAFIASLVLASRIFYVALLGPALELFWSTGWGPTALLAVTGLFIGGGLCGLLVDKLVDMSPIIRECGPRRSAE